MKVRNLLFSAALLATTLGGGVVTHAATNPNYPDATHAKMDASVQFQKDDQPTNPVDPSDPTKPIVPTDPTNPTGGELMITYASKLDFGSQNKTAGEYFAKADKIKDPSDATGTKELNIAPFVSIKDARDTSRKGWTLTAKLDDVFKDTNGNELVGAELTFDNMKTAAVTGAPTISKTTKLTTTDAPIATADAKTGYGNWSVALGDLQGTAKDTTDGVKLTVPSTSIKNTDTYKTSVTYTLTAQP